MLVGSQDASLSCLDLATGKKLWKHRSPTRSAAGPTVARTAAGDRVFLAGCDGRLHVIDAATGEEAAAIEIGGPTGTTPAVSGDLVLFGTEGGDFFAIDFVEAGSRLAEASRQPRPGLPLERRGGRGLAIVGTRGRAVEAFAVADGEALAAADAGPRRCLTGLVGVPMEGADRGTQPAPVAIVADAKGGSRPSMSPPASRSGSLRRAAASEPVRRWPPAGS